MSNTANQKQTPMFMSIRKAAEHTGLSEIFLRSKLSENKLPGIYTGRKFMVDIEKLMDSLRNNYIK